MKICDACGAELVKNKIIKPASEHFPPNEIPREKGVCPLCKREDNLSEAPELTGITGDVLMMKTIELSPEEFEKKKKELEDDQGQP